MRKDEVNHQTAGQDVPFKWRLSTGLGPVTEPRAIESVTSRQHSCADGAQVGPPEVSAGRPGVHHLADGRWQLEWVTRRQWAGTCRTFTLALPDGTTHTPGTSAS